MDKDTQKQVARGYIREFYQNNRVNFALAVMASLLSSGMHMTVS